MDFGPEDDAEIAEAIRLSLLEVANSANNTRARQEQQQQQQYQPPPQQQQQQRQAAAAARSTRNIEFIDLTDDPEPEVKAEKIEWREPQNNYDMSLDEEVMDDEHLQYVKALSAASQEMRFQESDLERSLSAAASSAAVMNGGGNYDYAQEEEGEVDEDFKKAVELSLASSRSSPATASQGSSRQHQLQPQQPLSAPRVVVVERAPSSPAAIFGMSRAEMELERQERIKKRALSDGAVPSREVSEDRERKRRTLDHPTSPIFNNSVSSAGRLGSSTTPTASSSKLFKTSSAPIPTLSTTSARPSSSSSSPLSASMSAPLRPQAQYVSPPRNHPTSLSSPPTSRAAFETSSSSSAAYPAKYHTASFRNTHILGTDRGKWDVRFQDLVNRNHLTKAILTTMDLEEDWLNAYIPHSIPQCRVKTWKARDDQVKGYQTIEKALYVHPPLGAFGSFHAKLMVLFYPTFVRIVISSANLVRHDWEQLVNTLYVQDFQMLSSDSPEQLGEFGSTLLAFLTAMELPDKIIRAVGRVDFRPAKVVLVPAVHGWHRVDARHTYGIACLAKVMQTRTTETREWDMEYQTSSLGKLTVKFLAEIYRASRGFTPRPRIKVDVDERVPPIKIIFPTQDHVANSRLGELGAGTVCLRREFWNSNAFPRVVMHDFELVGRHQGSLMHTKVILAKAAQPKQTLSSRLPPQSDDPRKLAGWFYVGSANCTESAWGTMSNKRSGDLQGLCINIRNWELGVVYMIETEDEMEELNRRYQGSGRGADDEPDQTFFGPLPVPYRRPVPQYYAEDEPWSDLLY
ncbi:hypothetical protein EC957_011307 [Mortierella hygrophila]|uniref:Uncharacterized protein n=1 Tax=Mortierella hygrophila TaxID=979708 RepID=A0A9P6F9C9_9FUNG|nr:hypothetical protein EC957_011307 [Mortierella hygrophila]